MYAAKTIYVCSFVICVDIKTLTCSIIADDIYKLSLSVLSLLHLIIHVQ